MDKNKNTWISCHTGICEAFLRGARKIFKKEVMLNIDHENIERILIGIKEGLRIPRRSGILNQDTWLEDFWTLSRDGDWFILDGR